MKTAEQYTDEQLDKMGARLAQILRLRHDPTHSDRWQMEGGNKTNIGLATSLLNIFNDLELGKDIDDCW